MATALPQDVLNYFRGVSFTPEQLAPYQSGAAVLDRPYGDYEPGQNLEYNGYRGRWNEQGALQSIYQLVGENNNRTLQYDPTSGQLNGDFTGEGFSAGQILGVLGLPLLGAGLAGSFSGGGSIFESLGSMVGDGSLFGGTLSEGAGAAAGALGEGLSADAYAAFAAGGADVGTLGGLYGFSGAGSAGAGQGLSGVLQSLGLGGGGATSSGGGLGSVLSSLGLGGGGSSGGLLDSLGGISGLVRTGLGLYSAYQGNQLADQIREQSDPFAQYRPYYGQRLAALEANPDVTQIPGYQAGLDAVQRSLARQGFTGSGNAMVALQQYGGDFFNRERDRLATLAGAGTMPGNGLGAAAQLTGQSLGTLGYTAANALGAAVTPQATNPYAQLAYANSQYSQSPTAIPEYF